MKMQKGGINPAQIFIAFKHPPPGLETHTQQDSMNSWELVKEAWSCICTDIKCPGTRKVFHDFLLWFICVYCTVQSLIILKVVLKQSKTTPNCDYLRIKQIIPAVSCPGLFPLQLACKVQPKIFVVWVLIWSVPFGYSGVLLGQSSCCSFSFSQGTLLPVMAFDKTCRIIDPAGWLYGWDWSRLTWKQGRTDTDTHAATCGYGTGNVSLVLSRNTPRPLRSILRDSGMQEKTILISWMEWVSTWDHGKDPVAQFLPKWLSDMACSHAHTRITPFACLVVIFIPL